MKQLSTAILFVLLSIFVSCTDESQSVSFTIHEIEVESEGTSFILGIKANCPWNITSEPNQTFIEQKSGNGDIEIKVSVLSNTEYDDISYQVVISSEDGTSTDAITINQKAKIGLEIPTMDMITENGGVIDIPIKTNDLISSIDTPDWITFSSSRALSEYTYSFSVKPNETGSVRGGYIVFQGKETSEKVYISQDSFAPSEVVDLEKQFVGLKGIINLKILPSYADWTKLTVRGSSVFELYNKVIHFEAKDYGLHNLKVLGGDNIILDENIELLPKSPIRYFKEEMHLNQQSDISFYYYSPKYITTSSDESVIKIVDGFSVKAVGYGTAYITTTHPILDINSSWKVKVEKPFLASASVSYWKQKVDRTFDINIRMYIEIPKGTTNVCYNLADNNNNFIGIDNIVPQANDKAVILNKSLNISGATTNDVMDILEDYTLAIIVNIDGKDYVEYIDIKS